MSLQPRCGEWVRAIGEWKKDNSGIWKQVGDHPYLYISRAFMALKSYYILNNGLFGNPEESAFIKYYANNAEDERLMMKQEDLLELAKRINDQEATEKYGVEILKLKDDIKQRTQPKCKFLPDLGWIIHELSYLGDEERVARISSDSFICRRINSMYEGLTGHLKRTKGAMVLDEHHEFFHPPGSSGWKYLGPVWESPFYSFNDFTSAYSSFYFGSSQAVFLINIKNMFSRRIRRMQPLNREEMGQLISIPGSEFDFGPEFRFVKEKQNGEEDWTDWEKTKFNALLRASAGVPRLMRGFNKAVVVPFMDEEDGRNWDELVLSHEESLIDKYDEIVKKQISHFEGDNLTKERIKSSLEFQLYNPFIWTVDYGLSYRNELNQSKIITDFAHLAMLRYLSLGRLMVYLFRGNSGVLFKGVVLKRLVCGGHDPVKDMSLGGRVKIFVRSLFQ